MESRVEHTTKLWGRAIERKLSIKHFGTFFYLGLGIQGSLSLVWAWSKLDKAHWSLVCFLFWKLINYL